MSNAGTSARPKHTHYVSLGNLCIYPALSSPSGYEDEHPAEYRPANPSEIEAYLAGSSMGSTMPAPEPLPAIEGLTSPSTLVLADEDPSDGPGEVRVIQQAPVIPEVAPPPAAAPVVPTPAPVVPVTPPAAFGE